MSAGKRKFACHFFLGSITKYSLLIILTTLIASEVGNAQTLIASAAVELSVTSSLSLVKQRDLSLGEVVQGVSLVTIDPVLGGNQAAYFVLAAEPNTSVYITYTSTNLTFGPSVVDFTGSLSGSSSSSQSSSTVVQNGNSIPVGSSGSFYFWAGGSATLAPDQPIGVYTGSFTISIAY